MHVPDRQSQHRPNDPWLQRFFAHAQEERGDVVEAPLVCTSEVAVLHLIREQLKRIDRVQVQGGGGIVRALAARRAPFGLLRADVRI